MSLPHPFAAGLTIAAPVLSGAVWLSELELWVRIVGSLGAAFGGICAGIYWLAKKRREDRYNDSESGL